MRVKSTRQLLGVVIATMLLAGFAQFASAQGANSHIGTWKLNLARSKYSPGPAPRGTSTKIEAIANGVKYTVDQVSSTGEMLHWEFSGAYDGKDNAVTGKNPNGDTVALTRVDANTVRQVNKLAGKVMTTQVSVIAADGRTRTLTTTGTDLMGRTVNNVTIYERQ